MHVTLSCRKIAVSCQFLNGSCRSPLHCQMGTKRMTQDMEVINNRDSIG